MQASVGSHTYMHTHAHTHTSSSHTYTHTHTHAHTHTHTHTHYQLKQQKSMVYFLNGVILIPTYFIVRILNLPVVFTLYAAQHHNWNVWTAVRAMYPICHIFNLVQFSLQIVWFSAIVRIAMKAGMLRLPWSKRSVSYASRVSKVD